MVRHRTARGLRTIGELVDNAPGRQTAGHGYSRRENTLALWNAIAGFLQQHLEPAETGAAAAP